MLEFDESTHTYTLDGKNLPSVTTILAACGMYDFDFVSDDTLNVAAERGTIIHRCIEWYESGTLDESSIDEELVGYFQSYLKTKEAGLLPVKPTQTEKKVYSQRFRYAGTLDQQFGDNWINDLKTGAPGAEHGLQLSAYWLAEHENMLVKPGYLTATYLHRDGAIADVIEYRYEPSIWLAVVTEYSWRVRNNKIRKRWSEK